MKRISKQSTPMGYVDGACPFCSELVGAVAFEVSEGESTNRCFELDCCQNIKVVVDRAPIDNQHLLLLSDIHKSSFRECGPAYFSTLAQSVKEVANSIGGTAIFFEHGMKNSVCQNCISISSCQDHAHLHVIPSAIGSVEFFRVFKYLSDEKGFSLNYKGNCLKDSYSSLATTDRGSEYVLLGWYCAKSEEFEVVSFLSNSIPSQMIKRKISELRHGSENYFNGEHRKDKVRSTIAFMENLSFQLTNENITVACS